MRRELFIRRQFAEKLCGEACFAEFREKMCLAVASLPQVRERETNPNCRHDRARPPAARELAVVASEVKALAQQTANATGEISVQDMQ
jgi:hypothetical protein